MDSEATVGEPTCYDYDPVYSWICGGYPTEWQVLSADTLEYDHVGNRQDSGASIADGNRLTAFGSYTFTYDNEGRTLTKSKSGFSQTYHWNGLSQLDSVTTVNAGNTTVSCVNFSV